MPASADEIRVQGTVWRAVLAPDGSRPDDHAMTARSIRLGRERDGIVPLRRLPLDVASRAGETPTIGGAPATVLVSVREQDLTADFGQGRGVGWIDGIETPIPISAVRDLISNGGQQKVVINDEGRIIALGSPERCFTPAQRRAIQLRDGTCIIPWCTIPAGMTEIHHVIPTPKAGRPTPTAQRDQGPHPDDRRHRVQGRRLTLVSGRRSLVSTSSTGSTTVAR